MAILIKGIDLPKKGEHIDLRIWGDGIAAPFKGDTYTHAIQIDRPHGRLVDISEIQMHPIYGTADTEYDAPTILEAEE